MYTLLRAANHFYVIYSLVTWWGFSWKIIWCLTTFYWCLTTFYWCLNTYWCLTTFYWCLTTFYWCLTTFCWCLTTFYWSQITFYWCLTTFLVLNLLVSWTNVCCSQGPGSVRYQIKELGHTITLQVSHFYTLNYPRGCTLYTVQRMYINCRCHTFILSITPGGVHCTAYVH